MTPDELIDGPMSLTHVILLGAGASRAAFPDGDGTGRRLPLMDDFVDVLGLRSAVEALPADLVQYRNFEALYSGLLSRHGCAEAVAELEKRVGEYFEAMALPQRVTMYDQLLLSLRPSDAVFTFNWDPFLFDAYRRNHQALALPEIFFLHGNVRIGACPNDETWGERGLRCPTCNTAFTPVPLLYPVENKDYSSSPYIRGAWHAARTLFKNAFTLTIFGYGAPESDAAAVDLLHAAWLSRSDREFEHIEIIDTAPTSLLRSRWGKFTPAHHYRSISTFEESRIANWPRRTCESLYHPMTRGIPCEQFPLPATSDLKSLQEFAARLARPEGKAR
jgi:hypothetical protein